MGAALFEPGAELLLIGGGRGAGGIGLLLAGGWGALTLADLADCCWRVLIRLALLALTAWAVAAAAWAAALLGSVGLGLNISKVMVRAVGLPLRSLTWRVMICWPYCWLRGRLIAPFSSTWPGLGNNSTWVVVPPRTS